MTTLTPEEYQAAIIEFNHQVFFSDKFDSLENIITNRLSVKSWSEKKNGLVSLK